MATIEFINGANKTYGAMKRVLDYILSSQKTSIELVGGYNCDVNNANNEFVLTKRNFNKETGRQYIHLVQSFAPYDKVTPEIVREIADELVQLPFLKGFQIAYAVHTDKDHLHTHFVINTVNSETGLKWKQSTKELQAMKDFSDELCRKRGLLITEKKEANRINRGEYRSNIKGQSWKHELYLAVKQVKWCSKSRDDFITNMKRLGYQVEWTDTRAYITFTTPEGRKCRNKKLYPPDKFTKEALEKAFELNQQKADTQKLKDQMDLLVSAVHLFQKASVSTPLFHYPLTQMESASEKDEAAEMKKGKGFDWDNDQANER